MIVALNNLFLLEPYKQGQGMTPEIRGGLSMPGQKSKLVALKLKTKTRVGELSFKAGDVAYVPEDALMTQAWAKQVKNAEGIEGEFIVVQSQHVVAVSCD